MKPQPDSITDNADAEAKAQPKLRYVPKPKGSWKKLVGSMKDCDLSKEAFRLGAEWRAKMNREGR
jgi:hypothetical protein